MPIQFSYRRSMHACRTFAKENNISLEKALDIFYHSELYKLMSEGVSDMHCMSDEYLADELLLEFGMMHAPGTSLAFKK